MIGAQKHKGGVGVMQILQKKYLIDEPQEP